MSKGDPVVKAILREGAGLVDAETIRDLIAELSIDGARAEVRRYLLAQGPAEIARTKAAIGKVERVLRKLGK